MNLKLGCFLFSCSLSLSLIPCSKEMKHFRSKFLWVGWCPYHSVGVPAWVQKVASSGSISAMLWISVKGTPIDSWAPPYSRSLVLSWRCIIMTEINQDQEDKYCMMHWYKTLIRYLVIETKKYTCTCRNWQKGGIAGAGREKLFRDICRISLGDNKKAT